MRMDSVQVPAFAGMTMIACQVYRTGPNGTLLSGSSTKNRITSPFIEPLYRSRYCMTSGDPPKCFPVHSAGPASAISAMTVLPLYGLTTMTFLNLYHSFNVVQSAFHSGKY